MNILNRKGQKTEDYFSNHFIISGVKYSFYTNTTNMSFELF